jgi:hypothetical protein
MSRPRPLLCSEMASKAARQIAQETRTQLTRCNHLGDGCLEGGMARGRVG